MAEALLQLPSGRIAARVPFKGPAPDVLEHEGVRWVRSHQGAPSSSQLDADISRQHRNAVYNVIRLSKAGTGLPQIQIEAGIHAAIRWLKHRAFQANDFYDIYHATAALPYCDIFLTEAFVGTFLKNPPLAFGEVFGTEIIWTDYDALRLLRTL